MRARFESRHQADTGCIFVVESDEVVRSALQFILRGHRETHGFKSLDQALLKGAELTPEIVMLGIGFLQSDGERMLAEIARRLPGAKILMVANSANDPLARNSLKWGAHDVLGKPIAFDSVHCKVDALLGRRGNSSALLGLLPSSAAW
ncbi:response regulator [Bradyrhizobium sp.]|uniref:response regulator n=1 Tax=Bradyrhizobium sp. TaxID=376 RepID=UPI004037E283